MPPSGMPPRSVALLAILLIALPSSADERARAEEEMLQRMLTLQHKSLFGERPLPLSSLDGSSAVESAVGSGQPGSCASSSSEWAAAFAVEQAQPLPLTAQAAAFAEQFQSVSVLFNDGGWGTARDQLYKLCLAGQSAAQTYEAMAHSTAAGEGGAPGGQAGETAWAGYAQRMEKWLSDCVTLVQYVPQAPPVREDHKRLLMLLHDLGGSLVLMRLHGLLAEALVSFAALGELGEFIAAFGEENRKTALSRALRLAGDPAPGAQADGAALLRRLGSCEPVPPPGAEPDAWADLGVRLCATLLLRARQPAEAVALLKQYALAAPTLHAYLGAFELASRVPPPPLEPAGGGGGAGEAPPLRFSLEQMLEVLEAALRNPQHGLASEGNLLRAQLRQHLAFGHPAAAHPAPPLACPPPPPARRQAAPRIVVVVPFVRAERRRLIANVRRWAAADAAPCAPPAAVDEAAHAKKGAVELLLYAAGAEAAEDAWVRALAAPPHAELGAAARCFRAVRVRFGNLTAAQQHYIGGWDNTGPNHLFAALFFDAALHAAYDLAFWMEADVYPVAAGWVERLREEARAPRGFWRKGPAQQPPMAHAMVSPHHYHMNSAGFYRLGEPCFTEFMRRVAAEHPGQPHDVSSHLFLHNPRHFHLFSRYAHRFLYTDLVQNRLDEWTLDRVRAVSPDTVFVHGKTAPFDTGKGGG